LISRTATEIALPWGAAPVVRVVAKLVRGSCGSKAIYVRGIYPL